MQSIEITEVETPSLRKLKAALCPHQQEHLLAHWDHLSDDEQQQLIMQIQAIDFEMLQRQRIAAESISTTGRTSGAKSPPGILLENNKNSIAPNVAKATGEAALRLGQVGMILVAGGQGTRLGFDHPKGMLPIGPLSGRTLFEIIIDRLRAIGTKYGVQVPLFVMTSPATTMETKQFFARHDNFVLTGSTLMFFEQGTMPVVDAQTWKVLLTQPGEIAVAPDGHGGMLAALAKHIGFAELRQMGIKWLFYGQIDNPLLPVCDPEFLGYHIAAGSELTTLVVRKLESTERVGVVAQIEEHLEIVEYCDLTPGEASQRKPDGTLELWAGNTAVHAFDVAFLERMHGDINTLPLHHAIKVVPHVDGQGNLIEPQAANAIKFEQFVFDLLPHATNALIVEADRDIDFAPVKNAEGAMSDTKALAQGAMMNLHTSWLLAAGAQVAPNVKIEIHPSWALDAHEVAQKVPAELVVDRDTYYL